MEWQVFGITVSIWNIFSCLLGALMGILLGYYRQRKYKLYYCIRTIKSFFRPFNIIGVALVLLFCTSLLLYDLYVNYCKVNEIVLAIGTGIIASAIITIFVECGNNYRNNAKREAALLEYIFELKRLKMYAKHKIKTEKENFDEISYTWSCLPRLIRILKFVAQNQKEWLSEDECDAITIILSSYDEIKWHCVRHLEKIRNIDKTRCRTVLLPLEIYKALSQEELDVLYEVEYSKYMDNLVEHLMFSDEQHTYVFNEETVCFGTYYVGNPAKSNLKVNVISELCETIFQNLEVLFNIVQKERAVSILDIIYEEK